MNTSSANTSTSSLMASSNSSAHGPYGPEVPNPLPPDSSNPIFKTDTYKWTHPDMLDGNGYTLVGTYAHITPRANGKGPDYVVVAGAEHIAATMASLTILPEHVRQASEFCASHLGPGIFNSAMYERIAANGGKIPLRMKFLPPGRYPRGIPVAILESTSEPNAVLWAEALAQRFWYLCSVCTRATEYRTEVDHFLRLTVDPELIEVIRPYTIHDFGARAASSEDAAKIGGLAVLASGIRGSDTLAGMLYAMQLMPDFDPATGKPKVPAESVPAAEHNVAFSWGKDQQMVPFKNTLARYPTGIVSYVIDTFGDSLGFVDEVTKPGEIRSMLMARKGKLVLRPDSPLIDPSGRKMTHGETIRAIFARVRENLVDLDASTGGIKINGKGYLVFPDWLGCIYGDSVTTEDVRDIYTNLVADHWSAQNIVFGVGGNLYQKGIERGTLDFAMKCSQQIYRNDATGELEVRDVGKTTPGKVSPVGRVKVVLRDGRYQMVAENDGPEPDIMEVLYNDGCLYKFRSLEETCALVKASVGF